MNPACICQARSGCRATSRMESTEPKPTVECFNASSILHVRQGKVLGMVDANC
jgi:hypothetical protein